MRGTGKNNSVKSREGGPQHMNCSFPCGGKVHLRRMAESINERSREWEKVTELETYKQACEAQNPLLTSKIKSIMNTIIEIKSVSSSLSQASSGDNDCGRDGCEDVDAQVSAGVPRYDDTGETGRYLPSPSLPASCTCCRVEVLCWELFWQGCFHVADTPTSVSDQLTQSQTERRKRWFNRFITTFLLISFCSVGYWCEAVSVVILHPRLFREVQMCAAEHRTNCCGYT